MILQITIYINSVDWCLKGLQCHILIFTDTFLYQNIQKRYRYEYNTYNLKKEIIIIDHKIIIKVKQ